MLFRSSLLTGVDVGSNLVLLVQTKSMKKIIVGAALLLMIRTAHATQAVKHSDERNILSTELPVNLQSGIKNQYGGFYFTCTHPIEPRKPPKQISLPANTSPASRPGV